MRAHTHLHSGKTVAKIATNHKIELMKKPMWKTKRASKKKKIHHQNELSRRGFCAYHGVTSTWWKLLQIIIVVIIIIIINKKIYMTSTRTHYLLHTRALITCAVGSSAVQHWHLKSTVLDVRTHAWHTYARFHSIIIHYAANLFHWHFTFWRQRTHTHTIQTN